MSTKSDKHWVVAITGASGVIYGHRLCEVLISAGVRFHLMVSDAARTVIQEELGIRTQGLRSGAQVIARLWGKGAARFVTWHDVHNIAAPLSSGSFPVSGMMIVPCSMSTAAAILHGRSGDLIERAADVGFKEGRPMIIVPRETPLSVIHLRNLYALAKMGVRVIPAAPGFYQRPQKISQLVDFIVNRVLDHAGIGVQLVRRWGR